eukprot:EG_transcript_22690
MAPLALITGATAGIGADTARRFVREGWKVVITGRRTDRLQALQAELGAEVCHGVTLDVRDRAAVEACIASLPEGFTAIDVLVNNAGLALGLESAEETRLDDWDAMVDTNCKGLMYVTRTVLPAMVARGSGTIINLGSVAGHWPYPGGNVYGATKAFVRQFSHNLRADLVAKNIRVTDIEPGLVTTEFSQVRFKGDEGRAAAVYQNTQSLSGADVADAIFWVASRPAHINIDRLEMMPTTEAFAGMRIVRDAP